MGIVGRADHKCPNCGALIRIDGASSKVTCEYCESVFNLDDSSEEDFRSGYEFGRQQAYEEFSRRSMEEEPAVSSGSKKSKTVALLLCVFLGTLGIHHFYAGKAAMGVLYLLTGGIIGIGWIIDIILIVTDNYTDSFGDKITNWDV